MNEEDFKKFLADFQNIVGDAPYVPHSPNDWETLDQALSEDRPSFFESITGFPVITSEHIPDGHIMMVDRPSMRFTIEPKINSPSHFDDMIDSFSVAVSSSYVTNTFRPRYLVAVDWVEETAETYLVEPWVIFVLLAVALVLMTLILGL